jgi:hypothetical protein
MFKLSVTERSRRVLSHVLWIVVATCVVLGLSVGTASAAPGPHKLAICHNGFIINVDVHAIPAHLEHGDVFGSCDGNGTCPCSSEFNPVICNGTLYANQCLATCAGNAPGDCESAVPGIGVCSNIFNPVTCTLPNGSTQTFANRCQAILAGCTAFTILCPCPEIYAPVRCGDGKIYINSCVAQCQGANGCTPLSTNPLQNSIQGPQKTDE